MQHFLSEGEARLVQGDALTLEDLARSWAEAQAANASGDVDVALFSVCGALNVKQHRLALPRHNHPHNLCSLAILNLLRTLPAASRDLARWPKLVIVSTVTISMTHFLPCITNISHSLPSLSSTFH
ncbi:hypothetical protein PsYK624_154020 [Phanerochaete sordida]|uniref:Uncharacterized protein n=1 Tax=Phanerochaete sordida TaxID=48140 RepID=A0A9P3GP84_9APHY|nr:hypothetical protein PsYK624_154020 [Phanerochaete sordida]